MVPASSVSLADQQLVVRKNKVKSTPNSFLLGEFGFEKRSQIWDLFFLRSEAKNSVCLVFPVYQ